MGEEAVALGIVRVSACVHVYICSVEKTNKGKRSNIV